MREGRQWGERDRMLRYHRQQILMSNVRVGIAEHQRILQSTTSFLQKSLFILLSRKDNQHRDHDLASIMRRMTIVGIQCRGIMCPRCVVKSIFSNRESRTAQQHGMPQEVEYQLVENFPHVRFLSVLNFVHLVRASCDGRTTL